MPNPSKSLKKLPINRSMPDLSTFYQKKRRKCNKTKRTKSKERNKNTNSLWMSIENTPKSNHKNVEISTHILMI